MLCPRCHRSVDDAWAHCPYDGEVLRREASISAGSLRRNTTKMAGAIVGDRFQIKGFVNKGATARVYLAEDVHTHEQVIVKLYAPDTSQAGETQARFRR